MSPAARQPSGGKKPVPLSEVPAAVLLPYQIAWVKDRAQVKVAEKSRRIGFTYAIAYDAVDTAARSKRAGGMDVWYLAIEKSMTQEFINYCAFFAQAADEAFTEEIIKDPNGDVNTYLIRFASGFRITAISSRPTGLRGRQGFVIIDEAAFHEHLQEVLDAAMALLIWGGRVAIISTHFGVDNFFNDIVQDIRAKKNGRDDWSLHHVDFDQAVAEGLYRRICFQGGKEWLQDDQDAWRANIIKKAGSAAQQELFCVPNNSSGAYIPRGMIEARMYEAPIVRLEKPDAFKFDDKRRREQDINDWCDASLLQLLEALPRQPHVFGEDFGRVADLTVITPGTIERNLRLRVPFLVELRNVPFEQQAQILFYILDRLPRFSGGAMDNGGNGMYLAEVTAQRYGEGRIEQIALSEKWYAENLPQFKASFEDGSIDIPKDVEVLSDLRALQVINGIPKLPKARTGTDKSRHGDSAISLALAHYASRKDLAEYDFHSASIGGRAHEHSILHDRWFRQGADTRLIATTTGIRRNPGGAL